MAEFREVMTRFARLCDYYSQSSCHGCPVDEEGFNCACEKQGCSKSNAEELEAIIMKWAAEHPEQVYPTWGEWFVSRGMLPEKWDDLTSAYMNVGCVPKLIHSPIPADLAVKLGLEPKEG